MYYDYYIYTDVYIYILAALRDLVGSLVSDQGIQPRARSESALS